MISVKEAERPNSRTQSRQGGEGRPATASAPTQA